MFEMWRETILREAWMGYFIVIAFLLYLSFVDMRKKKVPVWALWSLLIYGFCWMLLQKREMMEMLFAVIPGLLFLGLGKLSNEQIGYGDGLLITGLGLIFGWRNMMMILCIALAFSFFLAALVLITRKGNKKTCIPFIPCLTSGCLTYLAILF